MTGTTVALNATGRSAIVNQSWTHLGVNWVRVLSGGTHRPQETIRFGVSGAITGFTALKLHPASSTPFD